MENLDMPSSGLVTCCVSLPYGYLIRTSKGDAIFPMREMAVEFADPLEAIKAMLNYLCTRSWGSTVTPDMITLEFTNRTNAGTLIDKSELDVLLSDARKRVQERN